MTKHAQYLAASAVLASASLSGCATVKSLDGTESATLNPVEARIEADRYRRQAEHLDTVADMTEGLITRAWDTVSTAVSSNPSLAALLGPAGLLGGLMLPTPGQRRRESEAMAKGVGIASKGGG